MRTCLRRALAAVCAALLLCAAPSSAAAPDGNLHVIDDLGDGDGAQVADMDGDGRVDVVAASSRYRGSASKIYWYRQGGSPRKWTRHPLCTGDRLKKVEGIDAHDDDGDGVARDVVACAGPFQHTYLYTYPVWERREIELPADRGVWNARRTPYRAGGRHGIVLALANDHAYVLQSAGEVWAERRLSSNFYGHPLEDRIIYADLDLDGAPEAVIPNSGRNRLFWVSFAHVRPTQ